MIVLNIFGGPGVGKSTLAADVFAQLKKSGINAELCIEYAKDLIFAGHENVLDSQLVVFAEQYRRMWVHKKNDTEVLICECPLLINLAYDYYHLENMREPESFRQLVKDKHFDFDNLNYHIIRNSKDKYNTFGRIHSARLAARIDDVITLMIKAVEIKVCKINKVDASTKLITTNILDKLIDKQ